MRRALAWLLLLSLVLSGCGSPEAEVETTVAVETTVVTEPETEPTTVPTEPPVYRNPLNGEILEEPYTGRIFAHTITNTRASVALTTWRLTLPVSGAADTKNTNHNP